MRVGIVGGGQLAQMMAEAAAALEVKITCLEPHKNCPAARVAHVIEGAYDDPTKLAQLIAQVDVLTYEFENVSPEALEQFAQQIPIYPSIEALRKTQNRLTEKTFLNSLDIPTANFKAIHSLVDLEAAIEAIGFPAVLKTQEGGYDGKGQWVLKSHADFVTVSEVLKTTPCILEAWVDFERELSLIAVRNTHSEIAFYPLIENQHQDGILRESQAPYVDDALQADAE
ncbi:MAG TPA: ATP-grasp domain-containing protein, partial [Coxiellaceae bacterium]|nr:ATP-grasp domain-containing protein [Coxiellaceae bacterium]